MKKQLTALLLSLVLALGLSCPALAAEDHEKENAALLLYDLGLFQGTGTDAFGDPVFALDKAPTRAQSVTMLVRLLGGEEEALNGDWTTPFRDVPEWAAPYVGYAYEKGLTEGRSAVRFDPDTAVGPSEYLSFVLRALGYSSEKDFQWDSAWTFSDKLGLTKKEYDETTTSFTRGDMAWVSFRALEQKPKGQNKALWQVLGVEDFSQVCWWQENVETCQPGRFVLSFTAAEFNGKKNAYTKFEVTKASINGVPCRIQEQFSTAKEVKDHCKEREEALGSLDLGEAFALVYLTYDEEAAKAAAGRSETLNGVEYPVMTFQLEVTGTRKDGKTVEEVVSFEYFLNGYGGRL